MNLRHNFLKLGLSAAAVITAAFVSSGSVTRAADDTTTPIKHVVIIFQENISFDHYFGTYPNAVNTPGEPAFYAAPGTPTVNGLSGALLTSNPNSAQPYRIGRANVTTCDQDHNYKEEQQALNYGKADKFVEYTGKASGGCDPKEVMAYYDGNVVTGLWNYAQNFAMSDNSFDTMFGPSTVGALNLVSGQTHGVDLANSSPAEKIANPAFPDVGTNMESIVGDPQPAYDDCTTRDYVALQSTNKNVGDLLNAKNVTWGWFQGGFRPTDWKDNKAVCGATHIGSNGKSQVDYIPHHEPFQYYKSTSNPHHLPPSDITMIGKTDQANHQYDLADFWKAADLGFMPAVSYLKAPGYQDGHAQYSDPLLEQQFLVSTINHLQSLPEWSSTLIVIAYDDSDGWADHVMPPVVNPSADGKFDNLTKPGLCGSGTPAGGYQDRCGYGQRLPLLVISPYAKTNYVDHSVTDLTSTLKFIEDNWSLGKIGDGSFDSIAGSLNGMLDFKAKPAHKLLLDPKTGLVTGS